MVGDVVSRTLNLAYGPGCCYKSFQNEDFKGSLSSSYWFWGCQITGKKLATSCVDIMRKALRWLTDKIIIIINNTVPLGVNRVCVCLCVFYSEHCVFFASD